VYKINKMDGKNRGKKYMAALNFGVILGCNKGGVRVGEQMDTPRKYSLRTPCRALWDF
jgi:hypothetical protein